MGTDQGRHGLACVYFELEAPQDSWEAFPALPQKCPKCSMDYSERGGRKSAPIRAFATGLNQISLLLTKHLMKVLPEGDSRKLVAFSDSRQAAANLANDIESEQWRHLLQHFIIQELLAGASDLVKGFCVEAINRLRSNTADMAWRKSIREQLNDQQWDDFIKFYDVANRVINEPEFSTQSDQSAVDKVSKNRPDVVRVEDFLASPSPESNLSLPPIWSQLTRAGTCPGGISPRNETWGSLIEFAGSGHGAAMPSLRAAPPLESAEVSAISRMGAELRKRSWRALSGRLLYDLEAKGIGHFVLAHSSSFKVPSGLTHELFSISVPSPRILTEVLHRSLPV